MTNVLPDAEAQYRAGRVAKQRGDLSSAQACYTAALDLHPDYVDAWISLGILHRQSGRFAQAAECQQRALTLSADHPLALLNLGIALAELGEHAQAGDLFRRVLQLDPRSAEAHHNLAQVLWRDLDMEAARHWQEALRLRPDYADAAQALGKCLFRATRYEEAWRAYQVACRLKPDDLALQLATVEALMADRQYAAAREHYERMLQVMPDSPKARGGLAAALAGLGQFSRPVSLFRESLAAAPDDTWVHLHYCQLMLRSGEFAEGWRYYASRWLVEQLRGALERGYPQPKWAGESLAGKRLMLISEQGLGDEIMFASTFAEAIAEAGHCVIECDARLVPLFQRSFPAATFVGVHKGEGNVWVQKQIEHQDSLPPFDLWTAAGDFVASRRPSRDSFPRHAGYLRADPARVAYWAERLRELGTGLCAGLSWRGGSAMTNQTGRSISLDALAPLLRAPGVRFVCLQYGSCTDDIAAFEARHGIRIHHFPEALADYDETAALVAALDLVISVCTAVVHLGGALGKRVWVMAPRVSEWRYGHEGPEMIWYPGVTVHRQRRDGDWKPVVAEVRKALLRLP